MTRNWRLGGACTAPDTNPDDWVLDHGSSHRSPSAANQAAAKTCHTCPVRVQCRDDMLTAYQPWVYPLGAILAGWWWPSSRRGAVIPHPDDAPHLRDLVERARGVAA